MRKIQLQVFLFPKSLKRPSPASFAPLYRRNPNLRKRNKPEFWVKRGGLGAFVAENSTASSFVAKVAKTGLPGEFRTIRRRKPKLRKRNKHEFWAKPGGLGAFVAKNDTASFFVPKVAKTGLPTEFRTFRASKTKHRKRNKHEFCLKRGGLGAFVAKNTTASFFFQKSLKRASEVSFAPFVLRKPKL